MVCAGLAIVLMAVRLAPAQDDASVPFAPRVPLLEPRPAEGPGPDERWQLQRPPEERQPVASFLQSLQGTDVVMEVILGQARLLTTRRPIATEEGQALIAVGDPTVVDFEVLPNPRMIRLIGLRPGVTDLSIVTADDQTYVFEIHVTYDAALLTAQLRQAFPDTEIRIVQHRGFLILEGQVRTIAQAANIEKALRGYLAELAPGGGAAGPTVSNGIGTYGAREVEVTELPPPVVELDRADDPAIVSRRDELRAEIEPGRRGGAIGMVTGPQIINLMSVPGLHQVLLQVRIGELNRTALREIGADWFFSWGNGNAIGTQMAGAQQTLAGLAGLGPRSTAFGIFPSGNVEIVLRALRDNSMLTVLAEPNLIAMSGQQASFLAGGQFPIPVPQGGGAGFSNTTIQFKDFGVKLSFVPFVLDEDTIRLQVAPEVSSIDQAIGTTLIVGGDRIPGLNTRRVETTVELQQGSTLALAGLLQVELDANTQRIPGIGDLPYIGPLFSNTSHRRVEKELLVLVTPYLISPMCPEQVPPLPGSEILDPNDCEFYFLNRIEGRTGVPFRSTTAWDNPWHLVELMKLEQHYVSGPVGFSE